MKDNKKLSSEQKPEHFALFSAGCASQQKFNRSYKSGNYKRFFLYLRRNFFHMNLHEFQAKELLKKYNVPVQEGIACGTVHEAEEAYRQIKTQFGSPFAVVKAQIHAGGRGKGTIKETGINGVKVGKGLDEVIGYAQKILGGTLVTLQTGPAGKVVHKILVAQDMYYDGPTERKEFYLSVLLDRSKGQNVIMYSTEGGMNIEEVAHNTPDKIFKEWVHPAGGLQPFQARKIAFNLGLSGESFKNCVRFVTNLYNAYVGLDCSMLEINPLFKAADDKIVAVDCKMNLDENALMRHPDLSALRDVSEEDPTAVKAILINIFGGIVRCDRVAQGVIDAYNKMGNIKVPIIVRLQGTNAEEAKKLIDESGLKVQSAILLSEAADLVKKALA